MKKIICEYIRNELGFDDLKMTDEWIADYVALLADLLSNIRQSFSERDFSALRTHAHTLKGSSANIGAEPFRALALELQESADAKDERRCSRAIADLETLQTKIDG